MLSEVFRLGAFEGLRMSSGTRPFEAVDIPSADDHQGNLEPRKLETLEYLEHLETLEHLGSLEHLENLSIPVTQQRSLTY